MKLIRIAKGKETVIEEGNRQKLNRRLKELRTSTCRGVSGRTYNKYKVEYRIEE